MNRVVIVEDEELIRKGLEYTFNWSENNLVVIATADNGADGLKLINELNPDIVITDIAMPIMDGLEMLEKARVNNIFASLIISGYDEFHLAKKAIGLGVTDYLLKPLDHSALKTALEKSIKRLNQVRYYDQLKDAPGIEKRISPDISGSSKIVTGVVDFISRHFQERFGIQTIADSLQVSYATLCKKFKEETQITINDYISRYRIRKSIELMRETNDTIYMISDKVGFSDYKYFIRVFDKYVGDTPNSFMKTCNPK